VLVDRGLQGVDFVRGGIPDAMGGTLPSMMGWWTNLTSFSIFNNFVEGSIPSSIGNLTAMTKVNLGFNKLNGTIPWSVGSWAFITYVQLAVNKLSGTIPSSIGAWKAVNFVSVASNLLSGTIPSTVAALDNGYFFSNSLNGSMPTFGGYFCPKKGNGTDLLADCSNITGQVKVTCVCCTVCS
jgi:Leucine-rich repeat (LRR) protein